MSKKTNINDAKTVLITGGAGYIGTVLTQTLLDNGYRVKVVDLLMYGKKPIQEFLSNKNYEFIKGDIRDTDNLLNLASGCAAIVHLAAIVGAPESERHPKLTWDINYTALEKFLNEMKGKTDAKFVFVSTCSNYGASGKNFFATEKSALDPISPYAETKVAGEELVEKLGTKNNAWTILRLATVFGVAPRMRFDLLLNDFTRQAYYKEKLAVFGNNGRTFVHVKDVSKVIMEVIENSKSNFKIFNVGSDKFSNVTKPELATLVKKYLPKTDLELKANDLDARDYKVSFLKLKKTLRFVPQLTLDDGINEVIAYLTAHPKIDAFSQEFSNLFKYDNLKEMKISKSDLQILKEESKKIRRDTLDMVYFSKDGHIPSAFSIVEILVALYYKILNTSPKLKASAARDRFILSKGHACASLYSVLARRKFFPLAELKKYATKDGILGGHPDKDKIPGIEISTGSLGQGFPVAVGMAMSARLEKSPRRIYSIVGDGECNEGSIWEAAAIAAHQKLSNLTVIVDFNKIQSSGRVNDVQNPQKLVQKWESFGWNIIELNGHDFSEIFEAFSNAEKCKDKPTALIAHTIKGKGVSFMEDEPKWHTMIPTEEEYNAALKELGGLK